MNYDCWVFVATTYDNIEKTIKLYVDGNLVDENSWDKSLAHRSNVGWYIGIVAAYMDDVGWPHGPMCFEGDIDEVRIYNRALNTSEIMDLYQFEYGLVGYWNFDEGSGSIAYDSSFYENDQLKCEKPSYCLYLLPCKKPHYFS